jgi:hypothetical protein
VRILYDVLLVGGVIGWFIVGWLTMTLIHSGRQHRRAKGAGIEAQAARP